MRNLGLCIVAACLSQACSSLTTIPVTENANTTVQGGGGIAQLLGSLAFTGFANMDLSQSETLQNQGIKKNQINSVKLHSATLTVQSPQGQDLSFLSSLSFVIQTGGQPDAEVAHSSSFSGQTTVSLTVDDVELKPYVVADSMDITTNASGRPPNQDTTIGATMVFDVDVNIVGAVTGH